MAGCGELTLARSVFTAGPRRAVLHLARLSQKRLAPLQTGWLISDVIYGKQFDGRHFLPKPFSQASVRVAPPRGAFMSGLALWTADVVTSPDCARGLSSAAFRCIGLVGYGSSWDSLVPVWLVAVSAILSACLTGLLCQLHLVFQARAHHVTEDTEVIAEVSLLPSYVRPPSPAPRSSPIGKDAGHPAERRLVPRLRRGGGTLA